MDKMKHRLSYLMIFLAIFMPIMALVHQPGHAYAAEPTNAENKAAAAAKNYCDNVALDSSGNDSEYYDPCVARFKAYFLGDPPGPDCPTGDDTRYQWCFDAAKHGREAASKQFQDELVKVCSTFISNAKGGDWPDFSSLKGEDKEKAIDLCNKGLGQGLAYSPGDYPNTASCDPGNVDKKDIMKQACIAGRSIADAHLFTLAEVKSVAKSGQLHQTDSSDGATNAATNGDGDDTTTCEKGSFSFNWILCPIFNGVSDVTNWVFDSLIQPLLMTDPICLDPSGQKCDNTIFSIWSGFRIYGDIFLIIALLVIVFGESIGGGLIDAYTAKKILPRLLAAAILINLSIYIVTFLVDITNVVGGGLGQLLTVPLHNQGAFKIQPDGISQGAIGIFGASGLLIGGFALGVSGIALLLVGLIITGAIAMIGIFVTLIIRQSIITALILIAPVAFALWCLPNTASWFKRWWDLLFQMLLVYPMIVVIFAVADIMSYTTQHNGSNSTLSAIVSFMLLIIPLYLVPLTLRSSNRLLGQIHGAVSNVGRQINAVSGRRAIGGAGQQVGRNWEATTAGNRFRGGTYSNRRGRLNRFLQGATLATPSNIGFNPRRMRDRLEAARSAKTSALSGEAEKSVATRAVAGNDDLLAASLHGRGTEADARAYLQNLGQRGAELEQNVASIRQARRDMGNANFEDFAAANLAGTGTGYRSGPAEMFETINRVAGSDRARATRILASARGQAERAKRIDLAGSGFAKSAESLSQLYSGQTNAAAVNEMVTDEVLDVQSAGVIGTARNNALKNMVGALQRRTARSKAAIAEAKTPEELATAQHEYKRVLAHTASLLDVAGSSSPENAAVIGGVMGQHTGGLTPDGYKKVQIKDIHGNPAIDKNTNLPVERIEPTSERAETLHDAIEALRSDPEFQQYRREYGSARAAAAAESGAIPPNVGVPPEEQA